LGLPIGKFGKEFLGSTNTIGPNCSDEDGKDWIEGMILPSIRIMVLKIGYLKRKGFPGLNYLTG